MGHQKDREFMVTAILPFYNEEEDILSCIKSLAGQSYLPLEIIAVDDGSEDKSYKFVSEFKKNNPELNISVMRSPHKGPGHARNLAAGKAKGKILVFADADMVFDKDFINNLVEPIKKSRVEGTFTKEEYLYNKDNAIAVCWNINRYLVNKWKLNNEALTRILPESYPDRQNVFRAIKKSLFNMTSGFSSEGYTDDWSLSEQLGVKAKGVKDALCYHKNPDTWTDVFRQALWIGKNRFISGSRGRCIYNLIRYSFPMSVYHGIIISIRYQMPVFLQFKIVYDLAVSLSIISIFLFGRKYLYK